MYYFYEYLEQLECCPTAMLSERYPHVVELLSDSPVW